MAFGGTMIDANGPTLDLPIRSMVTGLIANALGWHRGERDRHQSLQDRLVMGARLDRPGTAVRDFQTAQLGRQRQGVDNARQTRGKGTEAPTPTSPRTSASATTAPMPSSPSHCVSTRRTQTRRSLTSRRP